MSASHPPITARLAMQGRGSRTRPHVPQEDTLGRTAKGAPEARRDESHRSPVLTLAAAMPLVACVSACNPEPEVDETALILECFEHTGEEDDPCPIGCAQVPASEFRVVWSGDGMCHIQGSRDGETLAAKFCAPGDADDYMNGNGWEGVFRRLDLNSPGGETPLQPEDVRVMSPGQVAPIPGWALCGEVDSALCGCAAQFTEE